MVRVGWLAGSLNTSSSFLPEKPEGGRKTKRDRKRKNSHPAEGIRLSRAGSVHNGNRRYGEAYRRSNRWSDSIADDEKQIHRAAFAARGQEVARAVRDPHAQASAGHSRSNAADCGRADEARSSGWSGCGDQSIRERA